MQLVPEIKTQETTKMIAYVKREYRDFPHRNMPGEVLGVTENEIYGMDTIIKFPTGEIEPFSAHEIELVE